MDDRLTYQIALSMLKGLSISDASEIVSRFGSERAFFEASESEVAALTNGVTSASSEANRKAALESASHEAEYALSHGIKPVYISDPSYPTRLADCQDAPLLIYCCGDCNLNSSHIVSIVGTRHATSYGISFIKRLVEGLARQIDDLVIVSGLAYGADITAHRAALACGVPTVAVMAHGLSTIYPAAHRQDAASIVGNGGMLLTEYRSDAFPARPNFLARNRIVAGLSDCTVVAESGFKGGSLSTARMASDYGRDVMALPGRTSDPYSVGCNNLIYTHRAALIRDADDLLEQMNWQSGSTDEVNTAQPSLFAEPLTADEQAVVNFLTANADSTTSRMCAGLGMPVGRLMSVLIELEFKGRILSYPGGRYTLA